MISIIIPVANEAAALRRTIYALVPEKEGHEIIVVDGGSVDGSAEIARSIPWVKLVKGSGRYPALCNLGAEKANGDVLLFLRPGVILERGWSAAVEEAVKKEGFGIGCFRLLIDGRHPGFRLAEALSTLSTSFLHGARAVQALFVHTEVLAKGPVFRDVPGLEDADLCLRHGLEGNVVQLSLAAVNPEDRWRERGVLSTAWNDFVSVWRWRRGEAPERLVSQYGEATNAVLLFVSLAKSRTNAPALAEELDRERAEQIQRGAVEQTLLTVNHAQLGLEPFLFFHPRSARDELERWIGDQARLVAETGRTETQRRLTAVETILKMSYRRVLLLSSFCPAMTGDHLKRALRQLERHDVVVGPTNDGGCYLVGVKEPHPGLFEKLQWSTDGLREEIGAAASELGLTVGELDVLPDLDSAADLRYNWAMGFVQS